MVGAEQTARQRRSGAKVRPSPRRGKAGATGVDSTLGHLLGVVKAGMVYTTSDARKKIVHGCNNEESRPAKSEWRSSLCYERSETESVKDGNEYNNTVMCVKRKEDCRAQASPLYRCGWKILLGHSGLHGWFREEVHFVATTLVCERSPSAVEWMAWRDRVTVNRSTLAERIALVRQPGSNGNVVGIDCDDPLKRRASGLALLPVARDFVDILARIPFLDNAVLLTVAPDNLLNWLNFPETPPRFGRIGTQNSTARTLTTRKICQNMSVNA